MSNKTAQELALREKIIQVRRDNTDCGCVPCDRYCREMRELVTNVIDDVLAEIDASFKALTPPSDDAVNVENLENLKLPHHPDQSEKYQAGYNHALEMVQSKLKKTQPKEGYVLVPEWQPIETAPKDGTRMLVVAKDGTIYQVKWADRFAPAYSLDVNYSGWYCYNIDGAIEGLTHWMPLPKEQKDAMVSAHLKEGK